MSPRGKTKKSPPRSQIVAAGRLSPANRTRQSGPAIRIFLAICDLWELRELERRLALGYPSRATFYLWCKRARNRMSLTLNIDVLCRISAILGIQQDLEDLFPTTQAALDWLRTSRDELAFTGQSPLGLITSGFYEDLLAVRRYLDAQMVGRPRQMNRIAKALRAGDDRVVRSLIQNQRPDA